MGMTAGFVRIGVVAGALLTASILALAHLGPAPSPQPRFLSNFPWSPASEAAKLGEGKPEGGQETAGGIGPLGSQEETNEHHHAGPAKVEDDEEKDSGVVEDDSMHEPEPLDEDENEEDDGPKTSKGSKEPAVLDSGAVDKKKPSALLEPSDIPDACKQMWMSTNDRSGFIRLLRSYSVEQYLEYGGGGSTLCAASIAKNVTTIEHNQEWCDELQSRIANAQATNINLVCSPVKWTQFGTTPEGDGNYRQFSKYLDTVHSLGIEHFDFIFLDGRARAAASKVVMNYLSNDSLLVIHDWERKHYRKVVLTRYDEIDLPFRSDQLGVLRKKAGPLPEETPEEMK